MLKINKLSPLYPFLLGLYPVLYLYSKNIREVTFLEVFYPMIVVLAVLLLLFLLLKKLIKNENKVALILALLILIIFSYGWIYEVSREFIGEKYIFSRHRFLIPLQIFILLTGIYLVLRTRNRLTEVTITL